MSSEDLGRLLAQLHARLKVAKSLDAESREQLLTLAANIEKALAGDADVAAPPVQPIQALAIRFEDDHPALAGVLRQIMDTLAKAGI